MKRRNWLYTSYVIIRREIQQCFSTFFRRAITTTSAADALHRGPRTREPRSATFYCKMYMLKIKVNLLFIYLESTTMACGQGMQIMLCMTNELLCKDLYF